MNEDAYENLNEYLEFEIKKLKLKINYNYGNLIPSDHANDLYKTLTDLQNIRTFTNYVHRNSFDKRFYEFMFSSDLSPYVDMRKLTHEIIELIVNARKLFPKKEKE